MLDPTLLALHEQFRRGATGELTRIQTTFIEIAVEQTAYRIDFRGKREFSAKTGAFSSLEVLDALDRHPLLLNYIEPTAELYFAEPPSDPDALLVDLQTVTKKIFKGWRDLKRYLNPLMPPETLLRSPGGMLLRGPLSLALPAQRIAEAQGMRTSMTLGRVPLSKPQVLILDHRYVVAEQFISESRGIISGHV